MKVNIDNEQELSQRYGVASIPTMILFKDGEPSAAVIGAQPKGSIEALARPAASCYFTHESPAPPGFRARELLNQSGCWLRYCREPASRPGVRDRARGSSSCPPGPARP